MATTAGDGGVTSMDDLEFIRRMYRAGAKGYFDVLGSHPYAFGSSPAMESDDGIADFLRPEEQRAVMLEFGDDSPIWATEFGWPIDPAELGREEYLAHPSWAGLGDGRSCPRPARPSTWRPPTPTLAETGPGWA